MKQIVAKLALVSVIAAMLLSGCGDPDGSTSGGSSGGSGGSATTRPGMPGDVKATKKSSSSIKITWSAPSSGSTPRYYNIWRATSATGTPKEITCLDDSTFSYTNTELKPSKTYYYWVDAQDYYGNRSDRAGPYSATTDPEEDDNDDDGGNTAGPGTPGNVTATAQSSSSIKITWSAASSSSTLKYYYIYRSATTANPTYLSSVSGTTLSYLDTNLEASKTYYYWVLAKDDNNNISDRAGPAPATTSAAGGGGAAGGDGGTGGGTAEKPGTPRNVTATAQSSSSIKITWLVPSSGSIPKYYNIYRSTTAVSTNPTYIDYVSGSTYSYTDTNLEALKTYYYWVDAEISGGVKGDKAGPYSATTSAAGGGGNTGGGTAATPAAPTGLKMSLLAPNENGFRVSWNTTTGASSYNIYKSSTNNFTSPYRSNINGLYFDDTQVTLTDGNSYYYRVTAVNSSGTESGPSTTIRVTVPKVKVRAYKPADGTIIIGSGKLTKGGIKLGSYPAIETENTSAETYSDYSSFSPGASYKLQYGYLTKVGSPISYKDKEGTVALKPFHEYTFNVVNGSTKEDKVNFVYY